MGRLTQIYSWYYIIIIGKLNDVKQFPEIRQIISAITDDATNAKEQFSTSHSVTVQSAKYIRKVLDFFHNLW